MVVGSGTAETGEPFHIEGWNQVVWVTYPQVTSANIRMSHTTYYILIVKKPTPNRITKIFGCHDYPVLGRGCQKQVKRGICRIDCGVCR
jgi:hypothetical protein